MLKEKISELLSCWLLRRLTLLGKVTVIKSLAASQLVYIMSSLPSSQSYLKETHQLLYNFLWDGTGDKIKRSVIINEYKDVRYSILQYLLCSEIKMGKEVS